MLCRLATTSHLDPSPPLHTPHRHSQPLPPPPLPTGAKEPAALEKLALAVGVKLESVNKDLMLYKGILSKLSVAKELMREYLVREKKKQAEREAAKAAKEAGVPAASTGEGQAVQA